MQFICLSPMEVNTNKNPSIFSVISSLVVTSCPVCLHDLVSVCAYIVG